MKPAASRNMDSKLRLLPPAAPLMTCASVKGGQVLVVITKLKATVLLLSVLTDSLSLSVHL